MFLSKTILSFILFVIAVSAQNFTYQNSIGKFEGASSFYVNPAGFVFVADIETDEVIILDTLGKKIHSIGGYGWTQSAFDSPVDIFADALKIFVADKNNHRIQRFDKNLNFIFQISTRENDIEETRFGYPLSAVMSNQGDIFILDSENSRIIKFDIFGNFIQNFGGYDYGSNALEDPKQLAVSVQNNVFVADNNNVLIYDQYGNYLGRIEGKSNFAGIRIIFNWLTVNTEEKIFSANLNNPELKLTELLLLDVPAEIKIVSSIIFNQKLYVLTRNEILIFKK